MRRIHKKNNIRQFIVNKHDSCVLKAGHTSVSLQLPVKNIYRNYDSRFRVYVITVQSQLTLTI